MKWLKTVFWALKKQHFSDLQIVYYARTAYDRDTVTTRNSFTRETEDGGRWVWRQEKIQLFQKQESWECIENSFNFSD